MLRVADVMHRGIVSCARTSTASEIAQLMVSAGVHCVAVLSPSPEPGHPPLIWGIVTDLNLLRALAEGDADATAETLAGGQVIRVRPTQTISEAANAMVRFGRASSGRDRPRRPATDRHPVDHRSSPPLLASRELSRC